MSVGNTNIHYHMYFMTVVIIILKSFTLIGDSYEVSQKYQLFPPASNPSTIS